MCNLVPTLLHPVGVDNGFVLTTYHRCNKTRSSFRDFRGLSNNVNFVVEGVVSGFYLGRSRYTHL